METLDKEMGTISRKPPWDVNSSSILSRQLLTATPSLYVDEKQGDGFGSGLAFAVERFAPRPLLDGKGSHGKRPSTALTTGVLAGFPRVNGSTSLFAGSRTSARQMITRVEEPR